MKTINFISGLLVTTVLVSGINYSVIEALSLEDHNAVSLLGMGFFILLCIGVYWLAKRASQSSNKYAFVRLVMINMMIKMFVSVIIIVAYTRLVEIDTNLFVLPFFIAYVLYTTFETYFLYQLSKIRAI